MLYSAKDIQGCNVRATDGELGTVDDMFFDDRSWLVEYVVVDTGDLLPGRRVLIPRRSLKRPVWEDEALEVSLTRDEIERAPGLETDPPLASDARLRFYRSYVWTTHPWGGLIGGVPPVGTAAPLERKMAEGPATHLRSTREITGYRVEATDGRLGHVEDFLFAQEDWTIQYVVLDTRNWLPGKHVVVRPRDIDRMDWALETAHVELTQEQIKSSPELVMSDPGPSSGPRLMMIR